jgi:hypothetical protein
MIYLTKENWNNLILSNLNNEESFKKEFIELYKIYNAVHFFSRKIYTGANEQQNTLIAAQIIFHKFRICSGFSLNKYSSEEFYIILAACLFIGQKAINILKIKIDDIASSIKQIINKKNPTINIDINDLNKKIIQKEYEILTSIGFNIEIDSPFRFFNKLKNYLSKSEINSENFIKLLNYILKDAYILPLSLYYTPNTIAISCVKILREKYKLNFINIKELISLSEYNIEHGDIIQCSTLIEKLEAALNEKKNQKNNNNSALKNEKEEKIEDKKVYSQASIAKVIPSIKMNIE